MGHLERLQAIAAAEAEFGQMERTSLHIPISWFAEFDELAEAIGITRSEVMREAMLSGLRDLQTQWEEQSRREEKKPRGA